MDTEGKKSSKIMSWDTVYSHSISPLSPLLPSSLSAVCELSELPQDSRARGASECFRFRAQYSGGAAVFADQQKEAH